MGRVEKGEQKTHGNGFHALTLESLDGLPHLVFVKWGQHLALRGNDALVNRASIAPADQGMFLPRHILVEAERQGPLVAGDMQNVTIALGREHPDLRSGVLQHDIGGDSRPVKEVVNLSGRNADVRAQRLHPVERGLRGVGQRTGQLIDHHLTLVLIDIDQIGKRSTDIDPDTFHGYAVSSKYGLQPLYGISA